MNPKHKEKEIGIQAEHLLNNELLKKWFVSAEVKLFKEFKEAAADDLELLRVLKARADSLEMMQKDLKRYVSSGKTAQKLLNEQKTQ